MLGRIVCVETAADEQSVPWVVGKVLATSWLATEQGPAHDPAAGNIGFVRVRANEPVMKLQLFETLEPSSSIYSLSKVEVVVVALIVYRRRNT